MDRRIAVTILAVLLLCISLSCSEPRWPDPDALRREAFDASEQPDQQAELEKRLHDHLIESRIKQGKLDEALEYAGKHDVLKRHREDIARLFVHALIDRGRFKEAVEIARSVPADQHGNGPSQLLQSIAFRQAQCGLFDDALQTTSFLTENRQWVAQHNVRKEERRCTLLKDGKPAISAEASISFSK